MQTIVAVLRARLAGAVARALAAPHARRGQAEWINTFMKVGIGILIAGAVFGFWKAGGAQWINGLFTNMQNY